jgi:ribonuclease-3
MDADVAERAEQVLEHHFHERSLLAAALTHASAADNRLGSNERLEFLGDAILGTVICRDLFDSYPEYLEGDLTRIKSAVVSRRTCAQVARRLGLTRLLRLGKGMSGRQPLPGSLAADVFEACIGALFLDGGAEEARRFILQHLTPYIKQAAESIHQNNYKSQLQQHAQRQLNATPVYELLDEQGPDHSKCFEVGVVVSGRRFPSAWGASKKEAEQLAAQRALQELRVEIDEPLTEPDSAET